MLGWLIGTLITPLAIIGSKTLICTLVYGYPLIPSGGRRAVWHAAKSLAADRDMLVYAVTVLIASCALLPEMEPWVFLLYLVPIMPGLIVYGFHTGQRDDRLDQRTLNGLALFGAILVGLACLSALATVIAVGFNGQ